MKITKEQYKKARKQKDEADEIINQYLKEKSEAFSKRLKENPIFKDEELCYAASSFCPCGHGLAYPKECGFNHYWDCSAILKGVANKDVKHTDQLPFAFYSVKSEDQIHSSGKTMAEAGRTTRGVFRPVDV